MTNLSKVIEKTWREMHRRAYDEVFHKTDPSYLNCAVCDDWHVESNFADWANKQPNFGVRHFEIDKDLTVWGNKVYSPDACAIIPQGVNKLFTFDPKRINKYAPNVSYLNGEFIGEVNFFNRKTRTPGFSSAFAAYVAGCNLKIEVIKETAQYYESQLSHKIFINLMELTPEKLHARYLEQGRIRDETILKFTA